jgi:hypothetical protein
LGREGVSQTILFMLNIHKKSLFLDDYKGKWVLNYQTKKKKNIEVIFECRYATALNS